MFVAAMVVLHGCATHVRSASGDQQDSVDDFITAFEREEGKDNVSCLAELAPTGFDRVLELYQGSDIQARRELLVEYFSKLSDPRAVALLAKASSSSDLSLVRCSVPYLSWDINVRPVGVDLGVGDKWDALNSLRAMQRTADPAMANAAANAARSNEVLLRKEGAILLSALSDDASGRVLERLALDESEQVRAYAKLGILKRGMGDPDAARYTKDLLSFCDKRTGLRDIQILSALCGLDRPEIRAWVARKLSEGDRIEIVALAFACRFLSPDEHLQRSLWHLARQGDSHESMRAVSTLAAMGRVDLLRGIDVRNISDAKIAWAWAYAMRKLGSRDQDQLRFLADSPGPARYEAMVRLSQLGVPEANYQDAVAALKRDARSSRPEARMRAAYVARNLDTPWAAELLKTLRRDSFRSVRSVAEFGRLHLEPIGSPTSMYEDAIAGRPELGFFDRQEPRSDADEVSK